MRLVLSGLSFEFYVLLWVLEDIYCFCFCISFFVLFRSKQTFPMILGIDLMSGEKCFAYGLSYIHFCVAFLLMNFQFVLFAWRCFQPYQYFLGYVMVLVDY